VEAGCRLLHHQRKRIALKKFLFNTAFTFCCFQSIAQVENYYNNIEPIIQRHCISCHNKASIGAMPFTNYKEVTAYGQMIQYVTERKLMPPWKGDAGYSHLKNYNTLNEDEIATIKNWIKNEMPLGKQDGKPVISPVKINKPTIKPDLVLAMENSFTVAGNYTSTSRVFVIPTNLNSDEIVEAIEFVPGNRKIIKSCTVSIDTGQTGTLYDNNDLTYGYSSLTGLGFIPYQYNWYQWTADESADFTTLTVAKKIPAGSKLLLHITYVATTTTQKDSSLIKFRFLKNAEKARLVSSAILFDTTHLTNGPFVINKGEKRKFYTTAHINKAIEIHSVMPMGQNALSSWEIYAIDSVTGKRFNILKIPYWDAHWKKKYILETPVYLSAGSKIFGIAYYNNSDDNPNLIILPPKKIKYGEGQRDELFIVQFDIVDTEISLE
jgi:hypothetical protein